MLLAARLLDIEYVNSAMIRGHTNLCRVRVEANAEDSCLKFADTEQIINRIE